MNKKPTSWKIVSSKVILDHKQLKITEDTVLLPSGIESLVIRLAPSEAHAVIMIAINSDAKILIQREYSYPPNKVMWQLPGGSMEPGESIEAAALRELAEESGFSAKQTQVLGSYYIHNRLSDKHQHIVLCQDLFEHKLAEDYDEFIETLWMSEKQLHSMITKGEFDNINLLAALNIWFHSKPSPEQS